MSNKKVRMLVNISGSRNGEDWPKAGETLTVPAAEAEDLIRQGMAAEPNAPEENALADVLGVEAAVVSPNTGEGQKSIREQIKPATPAEGTQTKDTPPARGARGKAGDK